MVFAKEIPDFTHRIVVPGILPHGRLEGSLFSFIILSSLYYIILNVRRNRKERYNRRTYGESTSSGALILLIGAIFTESGQ
jgi:hypothetical protein